MNIFNKIKKLWENFKILINTLKTIMKAVRKAINKAMEEMPIIHVSKAKDRKALHLAYEFGEGDSEEDE